MDTHVMWCRRVSHRVILPGNVLDSFSSHTFKVTTLDLCDYTGKEVRVGIIFRIFVL